MTTPADAGAGTPRQWLRLIESRDADPLEVLRTVGTYQRYLSAIELGAVRTARRLGHSWEDVAGALGIARQSAWARFQRADATRVHVHFGPRASRLVRLTCPCGTDRLFHVTGDTTLVDRETDQEQPLAAVAWRCRRCGQERECCVVLPES